MTTRLIVGAAVGLACTGGPVFAQFDLLSDYRDVHGYVLREILLHGWPVSEDYVDDTDSPPSDFADFNGAASAALDYGAGAFYYASATQVSTVGPLLIEGSGSARAEAGSGISGCYSDGEYRYTSYIEGRSRVWLRFRFEAESIVEIDVEQTFVDGDGFVSVLLGELPGVRFVDIDLGPGGASRYTGTFLIPPGDYTITISSYAREGCTPGAISQSDFTARLEWLGSPCNPADLAEPFGTLDLADIITFVNAFVDQGQLADIAEPTGVFDLLDLQAFIGGFIAGCP